MCCTSRVGVTWLALCEFSVRLVGRGGYLRNGFGSPLSGAYHSRSAFSGRLPQSGLRCHLLLPSGKLSCIISEVGTFTLYVVYVTLKYFSEHDSILICLRNILGEKI
jgi:hypothetical protein